MAGLKQRFEDWRAARRARHANDLKSRTVDPRSGLVEAKRDEQTKLQDAFQAAEARGAEEQALEAVGLQE